MEVQEGGDVVGSYFYDGDGNRVMSTGTVGNTTTTTLYVGAYYEKVNTRVYQNKNRYTDTLGWKKYYYAGSVRLAMREDSDDPLYLIGDHLGSTSLVLDTAGLEVAKQTYLPFGEEWGVSATELPTTFTYTGQREAAEIGLMYYVARWYDSEIGHFIQADTIVPDQAIPLSFNRFAYVKYNPLNLIDPSGHDDGDDDEENDKKIITIVVGNPPQEFTIEMASVQVNLIDDPEGGLGKGMIIFYEQTFPSGVTHYQTIMIDNYIDLSIDTIGIIGDLFGLLTILDILPGDEVPGGLTWAASELPELLEYTKAGIDATMGDMDNLLYDGSTNQITKIMENISPWAKLIPVVGIAFNVFDITQNIEIHRSITEESE